MIHFSGPAHPVIHNALLFGLFSAFDEIRLGSLYHQLLTRKEIMWMVLLISLVIQSSKVVGCSSKGGPGSKTRINSENKVERKDCNQEKCHKSSKLKGKKLKILIFTFFLMK